MNEDFFETEIEGSFEEIMMRFCSSKRAPGWGRGRGDKAASFRLFHVFMYFLKKEIVGLVIRYTENENLPNRNSDLNTGITGIPK